MSETRVRRARLVGAREGRGWSQAYVAEQIGTTVVNVSRWERGLTTPNPVYRLKLCRLFGATEVALDLSSPRREGFYPQRGRDPLLLDPGLPLPIGPLVGRSPLLSALRDHLCERAGKRTVALTGSPGVGKTALAIALSYDDAVRAHYPDGVLWASLGPEPQRVDVWQRWGEVLGCSWSAPLFPMSTEAWKKALHRAIGKRRALIVIDDAWRRADAFAFVIGGSSCGYILTCRSCALAQMFSRGEGPFFVPDLTECEAWALLLRLVPRLGECDRDLISDLVRATGGLPLALTVIGHALRQYSQSQVRRIHATLSRLQDAKARLFESVPQGPLDRYSSLRGGQPVSLQSVLSVADRHLPVTAQAALRRLARFPARPHCFSLPEALAVGCPEEVLHVLCEAGLVEPVERGYAIHPIVSDYLRLNPSHCDGELAQSARGTSGADRHLLCRIE